jgi:hypothetical protein
VIDPLLVLPWFSHSFSPSQVDYFLVVSAGVLNDWFPEISLIPETHSVFFILFAKIHVRKTNIVRHTII